MNRLNFVDYIEVLVGPEAKRFMVHSNKLIARSQFFKAACSERWVRSGSNPIELPTDDPHIFDMYLGCIYSEWVDEVTSDDVDESEVDSATAEEINLEFWVKTYILADKYMDIESCNLIMDQLIDYFREEGRIGEANTIQLVYRNTADASPLRKFFVDKWIFKAEVKDYERGGDQLPQAFLLSLAIENERARCKGSRIEGPDAKGAHYYHQLDKCCQDAGDEPV